MITVIQQPQYFPWLGAFEQARASDQYVFLDTVQWNRRSAQHRALVLASPGPRDRQWLSIPVQSKGSREKPFRELRIDHSLPWARKHWHALQSNYGSRPYFKEQLEPLVRPWLETKAPQYEFLADAARESFQALAESLGTYPFWSNASDYSGVSCDPSGRILDLCALTSATVYYPSLGGTQYLNYEDFRSAGIRIITQNWKSPLYEQGREQIFTTMSVLDALANVSLEEIRRWIAPKNYGPFAHKAPSEVNLTY